MTSDTRKLLESAKEYVRGCPAQMDNCHCIRCNMANVLIRDLEARFTQDEGETDGE